jgi:dipeptide transport system permease protein
VGIEFDITPVTGFMLIDSALADWRGEEPGAFVSAALHLVLPAMVLGTIPMAVVARMTRSSMLEVLREDYMRTARAKGLGPTRVVLVHGLRNALIPVITVLGMQVGSLLGGAVLTETIFSWPGIGKWLIDAIARRDYPVVQAGILISALIFIGVNLIVDLLYGVLNPRLRGRSEGGA